MLTYGAALIIFGIVLAFVIMHFIRSIVSLCVALFLFMFALYLIGVIQ